MPRFTYFQDMIVALAPFF